jgi:hypothetical protein
VATHRLIANLLSTYVVAEQYCDAFLHEAQWCMNNMRRKLRESVMPTVLLQLQALHPVMELGVCYHVSTANADAAADPTRPDPT